jgi:hypothetical protein
MSVPDRVSITGPFTLISEVVLLLGITGLFTHEAWRFFALEHNESTAQSGHFEYSLLGFLVLGAASVFACVRLLRDRRVTLIDSEVQIASLFTRRTVPIPQIRDVYWIQRFDGTRSPEAAIVVLHDGTEEEIIRFSPKSPAAFEVLRNRIPNLHID